MEEVDLWEVLERLERQIEVETPLIELVGKGWWKEVKEELLLACIESAGRDLRFATPIDVSSLFRCGVGERADERVAGDVFATISLLLKHTLACWGKRRAP